MKKQGKNLKISLSGDLKSHLKYDSRNFSSSRSIDTKFLFKNDQLKELSKFAFNPSSRDVSHIRDHLSVPLPKIVPSLPTDFSHLQKLYYSSDPLGNPFTISSSNLVSSVSCKKQTCIEKVMTTHNASLSVIQDDFPSQSIERLNFCNPSGRQDIKSLQSWLKNMKDQNLQMLEKDPMGWESDLIEKAEIVYVMAGKELVRQVGVHCFERGEVLKEVLWFFNTVFKTQKAQYVKDLKEKIERVNKQIEEKIYKHARQIAQYEILVQKKTEKIDSLSEENEKLNQMLQKTQINLIKFQSAQEIKGGFLGIKQISPVLHISSTLKTSNEKTSENSSTIKPNSEKTEFKETEIFSKTSEKSQKILEKTELKPETIQITTVNEIINGEMQNNEKTCQAEELKIPISDQETQTDSKPKKLQKPNQKLLSRLLDSKLKFILSLEFQSSLSIIPNQSIFEAPSGSLPYFPKLARLPSMKLDTSLLTKAQKTLKSYEDELLKLSETSIQKRASLILSPSDLSSKPKSRLSPQPSEDMRSRRSSQQTVLPLTSEDDILLSNILAKQKAYNDLADSIKSKKSELSSITSEIEEKSQKLNTMKKEIQVKYLEIQATRSTFGLNRDLKKILINRLESEPSQCESPGVNDFDLVVSSQFEVDSWKAGYNAGFEKGLAVGFRQGEELGIEVGEDQGYIRTIKELDEVTDSKSESSSESEKEGINERIGKDLKSRVSMMSISTSKSTSNEKIGDFSSKFAKNFESARVQRSITLKNEVRPKLTTKRSMDSFKPTRNSLDSVILEEGKRNNSNSANENSTDNSRVASRKLSQNKNVPNRSDRRGKSEKDKIDKKNKFEMGKETFSVNNEESAPSENSRTRGTKEKLSKKEQFREIPGEKNLKKEFREQINEKNLKKEFREQINEKNLKKEFREQINEKNSKKELLEQSNEKNLKKEFRDQTTEKTLKKQQTFLDTTNKELITITINQEENHLIERPEEQLEANKLIIRPKRSRKNSTSSKYSKSDMDDQEKILTSGGEDFSECEPKKKDILRRRIREITKFNEFHFHTRSYQFVKKANPAIKIIENYLKKNVDHIIKRSKMSKRMAFRLLTSIYNSFHSKSKETILLEHLYDEFLLKYSVKSVCEKKLKEFLAALLKFSACRRSMTFLKLTGISTKLGISSYSPCTIPVYSQALNFLMNSKIGIVIAFDETAEVIMIPVVRAFECVKELFEGKFEKNQISKILARLEFNSLKDPKKINTAGLIENELALEIISESFEEYSKGVVEGVEMIFNAIRFKEDASCMGRGELAMVAAVVSPGKWKEEDFDESGFFTFDEVVSRCLEKNLMSIEEVRNFVIKEERLANERDFKEDVNLMFESLKKSDKKVIRGLTVETWLEKINNLRESFEFRDILESFIAWRIYFNELIV
jgi:hypothetical protein